MRVYSCTVDSEGPARPMTEIPTLVLMGVVHGQCRVTPGLEASAEALRKQAEIVLTAREKGWPI